jgi:hypothetical protein
MRVVSFDLAMILGLPEAYINMTNNAVDGIALDDKAPRP